MIHPTTAFREKVYLQKRRKNIPDIDKEKGPDREELININKVRYNRNDQLDKEQKFSDSLAQDMQQNLEILNRQVHEKKKGEENLRSILESVPQITFTASADGEIVFFNKYALTYLGLSIDEANSQIDWKKIIHPDELTKIISQARHSCATGEDFYKEINLKRNSDGKYRWHLLRAAPIKDNRGDTITSWVGVATDIQEQKLMEQKKDEFINIASHEMKTPLAVIRGYLELLEMTLDVKTEAALFVNKALCSVTRLNNLINELLEVGKMQNGKLNYIITSFDFNKMVDDTLEDQRNASFDYKIIKNIRITSEVKGDRDRLQQVVINLLSNAIKYSPKQKKIIITAEEKNNDLIFSMKDNGIGISKDNLENVFKRYFRVENQSGRFPGMGIGLFISHEIIERHGGKMWVESAQGKGSSFYFSIPIDGIQLQEQTRPTSTSLSINKRIEQKKMLERFKKDVADGLSNLPQKTLPSKYFYDAEGDELFVKIMALPEYYLTKAEMDIFQNKTKELLAALHLDKTTRFDIIDLGAGDGTKTVHLLEELLTQQIRFDYFPVDISKNALDSLQKMLKKKLPGLCVTPQHKDYFQSLSELKKTGNTKIILFLGSNIGNLPDEEATEFIYQLGANLQKGDKIILGVDLIKPKEIVSPAYNDAQGITAAFNLNLLNRINRELGADFDVNSFEHYPTYNEHVGIAKSYLKSKKEQSVMINGQSFDFTKGELIHTEISRKYNDVVLKNILSKTDITWEEKIFDDNKLFANYILVKH